MPVISIFLGIIIRMNFNEHLPPHFHAQYNDYKAVFDFEGNMLEGNLPKRQQRFIAAWCEFHSDELAQNWELARAGKPLEDIKPLTLKF